MELQMPSKMDQVAAHYFLYVDCAECFLLLAHCGEGNQEILIGICTTCGVASVIVCAQTAAL